MGRRKKLSHFQDLHEWTHVFEPTLEDDLGLKGTWGNPVILELACGQGAYTLALAERHPESTVIGIDIKGSRMWHGAQESKGRLPNACFLRARIEDLEKYFAPAEVNEIWITFPDPHLREGRARKRLTSDRFLKIYRKILKPGGQVHLKTDSKTLYDWTKETAPESGWMVARDVPDVYAPEVIDEVLHIITPYERRHLKEGRMIRFLSLKKEI